MKKVFFILTVLSASFFSCKKSNDSDNQSSFTWTISNTNYVATIDTAFLYSMSVGPIIIAGTGNSMTSTGASVRAWINSFSEGRYVCATGTSTVFTYIDESGNQLFGDPVTINITHNGSDRISGNFSGQVKNTSGSILLLISGSFSNVPVVN